MLSSLSVKLKVLLAVLIVVVSAGCTPGEKDKKSQDNTGGSEKTAVVRETAPEKKKLVFGSVKKKTEKGGNTTPPVTDLDPGDYATLLVSMAGGNILPSDMEIGELQDYGKLDKDKRVFFDDLMKFFSDAFKGTPDEEMIAPSVRDTIVLILKKVVVNGDITVRIGKFRDMDGYLDIPVRLFSGSGRTEGDVAAELVDGRWMISSLSINPEDLNKPYDNTGSQFEPDSYLNLRLEY